MQTKNLVVFLQNAWSPFYAGMLWPRNSWLRALKTSRSGQRLKYLIDDFDLCENLTPMVANSPKVILPPDENYILSVIKQHQPKCIVACGKQAENTLIKLWEGSLLIVPHPTYRLVTNKLYLEARSLLSNGFDGRLTLYQGKGQIIRRKLLEGKEI